MVCPETRYPYVLLEFPLNKNLVKGLSLTESLVNQLLLHVINLGHSVHYFRSELMEAQLKIKPQMSPYHAIIVRHACRN